MSVTTDIDDFVTGCLNGANIASYPTLAKLKSILLALENHTAPYLFARKSANQGFTSGAGAVVSWDTFVAGSGTNLTDGVIYLSSNRVRVTEAGLYEVHAHLRWESNSAGTRYAYQQMTGASGSGSVPALNNWAAVNGDSTYQETHGVYAMTTSDYVEVWATQTSGTSPLNLLGGTTFDCALRVTRLRKF